MHSSRLWLRCAVLLAAVAIGAVPVRAANFTCGSTVCQSPGFCCINDVCVPEDAKNPQYPEGCLICKPSLSINSWSLTSECYPAQCSDPSYLANHTCTYPYIPVPPQRPPGIPPALPGCSFDCTAFGFAEACSAGFFFPSDCSANSTVSTFSLSSYAPAGSFISQSFKGHQFVVASPLPAHLMVMVASPTRGPPHWRALADVVSFAACCPGYYCPERYTCMFKCSIGAYCPSPASYSDLNGASRSCNPFGYLPRPSLGCGGADADYLCDAGSYCPNPTQIIPCPSGSYCRQGFAEPRNCPPLSTCNAGASQPDSSRLAVTIIVVLVVVLLILIYAKRMWSRWILPFLNYTGWARHFARIESLRLLMEKERTNKIWKHNPDDIGLEIEVENLSSEAWDAYEHSFKNLERHRADTVTYRVRRLSGVGIAPTVIKKPSALKRDTTPSVVLANDTFLPKLLQLQLSCRDLCLEVGGKRVLDNVSVCFKPGEVTAVMGPSGSGKSSLVTALLNKAYYGKVSGDVMVNGVVVSPAQLSSLKSVFGYCPQEHIVLPELTVYETLMFNALWRLDRSTDMKTRKAIVMEVLQALRLTHRKDSLVGDAEARGISGGERARVNIGMELVANPLLLVCDEATSGLDSNNSHHVISVLRAVARLGATVIVIIHQPRYETFKLFDSVLLMAAGGRVAFQGSTVEIEQHFASLGLHTPPQVNPADFYLDCLTGKIRPKGSDIPVTTDSLAAAWLKRVSDKAEFERQRQEFEEKGDFQSNPLTVITERGESMGSTVAHSDRAPSQAQSENGVEMLPAKRVATVDVPELLQETNYNTDQTTAPSAGSGQSNSTHNGPMQLLFSVDANPQPRTTRFSAPLPGEAQRLAQSRQTHNRGVSEFPAGQIPEHSSSAENLLLEELKPTKPTPSLAGAKLPEDLAILEREQPNFFMQFVFCAGRGVLQLRRKLSTFISDCVLFLVIGFLLAVLFRPPVISDSPAVSLFITMTFTLGATMQGLRIFGEERIHFWREAACGINRGAYFLGKNVASLVPMLIIPLIFMASYYSFYYPYTSFNDLYRVIFLATCAGMGLGQLVSLVSHPTKAQVVGVVIGLLSVLLCGFSPTLKELDAIGVPAKILYSISISRWLQEAFLVFELKNYPPVYNNAIAVILDRYKYDQSSGSSVTSDNTCLSALVAMLFLFRLAAYIALVGLNRGKQR